MQQQAINNEYVGCIYKATNIISNKSYIGQTIRNFEIRKKEHIRNSINLKHKDFNCHFYRALRKYGKDNFIWEIIEIYKNSDKNIVYEMLFKLEEFYVNKYNSFKKGYNSDIGGKGSKGRIVSNETRLKLRKIHLGKKMSTETKELLRNQRLGKKLSPEHIQKIKLNTKKACENNPERSKKIKDALQLGVKVFTEDGKLINTFDCIKDGSKFYNVDASYISKNCKRIAQTSGKLNNLRLIWRYIEDDFTLEDKNKLKPIIIEIFSEDGKFIKEFNSAKDLCSFYNLQSSSVSQVLSGKRKHCIIPEFGKIKIKYKNMFNNETRNN